MENPLVKELRDRAARETKQAKNPFEARKELEWRAADQLERCYALLLEIKHAAEYHDELGDKIDSAIGAEVFYLLPPYLQT